MEHGERQTFAPQFSDGQSSIGDYRGFYLVPTASGTLLLACGNRGNGTGICQSWTFDHAGAPTGGSALTFAFSTDTVSLASLDGAFLVVIENQGSISILRLDESGAFLDTAPKALAAGTAAGAVSVAGSLGAVWADGAKFRRASVAADGTIALAAEPLLDQVALEAPPKLIELPDGLACLSLEDSGQVVLRFFSATWELTGKALALGTAASKTALDLSVSPDAKNLIATWSATDGSLVSRSIALAKPTAAAPSISLSSGPFDQETPQALRFDDHWVVAWSEGGVIRSARVDNSGRIGTAYTRILPTRPYSHAKLLTVAGHTAVPEVVWQEDDSRPIIGGPVFPVTYMGMQTRGQMNRYDLSVPGPVHVLFAGLDRVIGYVDHSGSNYVVAVRNYDGDRTKIATVSALPPGASTLPFDLVAIDGGYRVWWADEQGHVRARDVRDGVISDGPDLAAPTTPPTFLSATATAVLAGSDSGVFFNFAGNDWSPAAGSLFSDLIDVDGSTSAVSSDQGTLRALFADPNGVLTPLDTIGEGNEPSLSEAFEDQTLLAFSRQQRVDGTLLSRVYVSLLTTSDLQPNPADQGGQGGESTAEGGEPATSEGGEPATSEGGAPNAGRDSAGGTPSKPIEGLDRTSCACRAVGNAAGRNGTGFPAVLALALVFVRRRR